MGARQRLISAAVASGIAVATCLLGGATPALAATRIGGVDMQAACNSQQPAFGLRAVVKDQHNAYSWRCEAPWGYSTGIDVNRACTSQYGPGTYAGLADSRNPYTWYCQR